MRRLVVLLVIVLGLSTLAAVPPAMAAEPQPGECEALASADLLYSAPRISGVAPVGRDNYDCYVLPDQAGTLYRQHLYGGSSSMAVFDADGHRVCSGVGGTCRLTGPAPFELRVYGAYGYGPKYRVQLLRMNGDSGCPEQALTSFGSTENLFRDVTQDGSLACWSIDLDKGGTLMVPSAPRFVAYDATGEQFCHPYELYEFAYFCEIPTDGRGMFVAYSGDFGSRFAFPVLDSRRTEGCSSALSTSWTTPSLQLPAIERLVDCRSIEGEPGERLLIGAGLSNGDGSYMVLDATGKEACFQTGDEYLGCRLEGTPPYRFVSWVHYAPPEAETYRAGARSLRTASTDCPVVTPLAFGTAPEDRSGVGCRQFVAEPGQDLGVTSIGTGRPTPYDMETEVVDSTGRIVCRSVPYEEDWDFNTPIPCTDMPGGRHFIVTNWVGFSEHVTSIYDSAKVAECQPAPLGLTAVEKAVPPGLIDCYDLPTAPHDLLWFASPGTDRDWDGTLGRVLRPDGTALGSCDHAEWCLPEGGPNRLIVSASSRAPPVQIEGRMHIIEVEPGQRRDAVALALGARNPSRRDGPLGAERSGASARQASALNVRWTFQTPDV